MIYECQPTINIEFTSSQIQQWQSVSSVLKSCSPDPLVTIKIFSMKRCSFYNSNSTNKMIDCGQSRFVTFLQRSGCPNIYGFWCDFQKGRLPLVFIDREFKINKEYYKEEVLEKHLLLSAAWYGNDYFCLQQDGAPSHTKKIVQK
jgi:hypothetical protein